MSQSQPRFKWKGHWHGRSGSHIAKGKQDGRNCCGCLWKQSYADMQIQGLNNLFNVIQLWEARRVKVRHAQVWRGTFQVTWCTWVRVQRYGNLKCDWLFSFLIDKNESKKTHWGQTVDDLQHQAKLFGPVVLKKLWKDLEHKGDLIGTVL